MTRRIICPYCHTAIDPLTFESAVSAQAHCRICPECDAAIVLPPPAAASPETLTATRAAGAG